MGKTDDAGAESSDSRTLIILFHGYARGPETLDGLAASAARLFPTATILKPVLPIRTWSFVRFEAIVTDLLAAIDAEWIRAGGYTRILLVGHSAGAVLARAVYAAACKRIDCTWAAHVGRIVLLAGMNRGWTISHNLGFLNAVAWRIGTVIGFALDILSGGRLRPFIFDLRRGSASITRLRLDWLEHCSKRHDCAQVVQLLGTIDDMVSPDDNIDLATGGDFAYLDVPFTGHADIVDIAPQTGFFRRIARRWSGARIRTRRILIESAMHTEFKRLKGLSRTPSDRSPEPPDSAVTDVLFVIHGIRDRGYWTHKIARRVLGLADEANRREGTVRKIRTETSSYGYFPMLPFVLPWTRRAKVEWLMDRYVEAKARYPRADFQYVGHSNGTYLLARALLEYPDIRFRHAVFAGSVVRTDFDWSLPLKRGQIAAAANYVATADWVVALFPAGIELLRLQDLGGAGHLGFTDASGKVENIRFVRGQHSAALAEENWTPIAKFILYGKPQRLPAQIRSRRPKLLWRLMTALAPALWVVAITLLVWGGVGLWGLELDEWLRTLLIVIYVFAIWQIVTQV